MLPKLSPDDLKGFATAISRSAHLLSLASLTPVVLRGRMTFASARTRKPEETDDPASTKKESGIIPCGFLSLLLLFASEVIAGFRLLLWPSKDSGLVQALEAGKKVMKKLGQSQDLMGMGFLDRIAKVFSEVLKTKQVFFTVHSGVMICVLLGALLTGIVSAGMAAFSKGGSKASYLARLLGFLAPAVLLVVGHFSGLSKSLRSPSSELCHALQMLLRISGLVLANDDTPPVFAVFQAASLLTKISGDVATGNLAKDLGPVRADWHNILDSQVAAIWLPTLSSVLLSATAVLSTFTSPVALTIAWPEVTKLVGTSKSPEGLTELISILYGVTAAGTLISGGSIGMLSVMMVIQILTRIHGTEIFSSLA
eukprot:symbB.v1.2.027457.t1/scaffold2821.1/size70050/3